MVPPHLARGKNAMFKQVIAKLVNLHNSTAVWTKIKSKPGKLHLSTHTDIYSESC